MSIKKTSLYDEHVKLGAKMASFGGFEMPIQYSSVKEEVQSVRNSVGVFDVSHMGEFFVTGPDAVVFVDYIMTNNFATAPIHKAVYSPICRENGTVIDDLIAYKLEEEKVLICVNASNIEKDWDWLSQHVGSYKIELENNSNDYSLLALQGPNSEEILKKLNILPTDEFSYYSANEFNYEDTKIILARTGYTGEDGFEIFSNHQTIKNLWQKLMDFNVSPCGLASRDVLRLEVCYPLYGHEINDETTPLDAALKWTVKTNKRSFIGKETLSELKPLKRLVKLSLPKGIPRQGYEVENTQGQKIGIITSGTMSVTTGQGIAMALIDKDKFPDDKNFIVNIRNKKYEAIFHKNAFVTGGHK